MEDLRRSLQTLADDHLTRLALDELAQPDGHLLQRFLEAGPVLAKDEHRLTEGVVIEGCFVGTVGWRPPPVAQQPAGLIDPGLGGRHHLTNPEKSPAQSGSADAAACRAWRSLRPE